MIEQGCNDPSKREFKGVMFDGRGLQESAVTEMKLKGTDEFSFGTRSGRFSGTRTGKA